ncbi:hypothetical protein GCM10027440_42790 [Nocardiopsis coralliicola]
MEDGTRLVTVDDLGLIAQHEQHGSAKGQGSEGFVAGVEEEHVAA